MKNFSVLTISAFATVYIFLCWCETTPKNVSEIGVALASTQEVKNQDFTNRDFTNPENAYQQKELQFLNLHTEELKASFQKDLILQAIRFPKVQQQFALNKFRFATCESCVEVSDVAKVVEGSASLFKISTGGNRLDFVSIEPNGKKRSWQVKLSQNLNALEKNTDLNLEKNYATVGSANNGNIGANNTLKSKAYSAAKIVYTTQSGLRVVASGRILESVPVGNSVQAEILGSTKKIFGKLVSLNEVLIEN